MKYICSLITVADIAKSKEFYETVLEQKVAVDYGQNVAFESGFAIHLSSHFKELINNQDIKHGGNNFELYFEHNKLEEIIGRLKPFNVQLVHDIREQPWRQKVLRFYDLDQNIIEVGETMEYLCYRLHLEGLNNDEVSTITYLPIDVVKNSIEAYSKKELK